jgi:D-glycero-D-manno-heptose 1,7-bisphosphate phosphatase
VKLIILDRDGVLNRHLVDPEQGTIDSPQHERQVEVSEGAAATLARLQALGYGLCIATNQPSAAKGKTTRANLEAVHARVVREVEAQGARILSSHICFHRSEDRCACRKPKPGLLEAAFAANPTAEREGSWMVGDGVTDVEAGQALGLRTAFIGARRCDACRMLQGPQPTFWGSLAAFADFLEAEHGRP